MSYLARGISWHRENEQPLPSARPFDISPPIDPVLRISPLVLHDARASREPMQSMPLLRHVLNEDALTRQLGDEEARVLVEWLVDWAELLAKESDSDQEAWDGLRQLCRKARGISRFVQLWTEESSRGAAVQLAAAEKFAWPLPFMEEDPAELMVRILAWEDRTILV